jgi:hypothetical protein
LNQNVSAGYQVMKLFTQPHKIGVFTINGLCRGPSLVGSLVRADPTQGKGVLYASCSVPQNSPRNSAFSNTTYGSWFVYTLLIRT